MLAASACSSEASCPHPWPSPSAHPSPISPSSLSPSVLPFDPPPHCDTRAPARFVYVFASVATAFAATSTAASAVSLLTHASPPPLAIIAEKARLHVPAAEAYGDKGFPEWGIGPGADLVFEIEVLEIANGLA